MSESKHQSERIELETVICWPMIALGAGLAVGVLAIALTLVLLAGPSAVPKPPPEQALVQPPTEPAAVPAAQPLTMPVPAGVVATPELLPPPGEMRDPVASLPPPVAVAPVAPTPPEPVVPQPAVATAPPPFKRIRSDNVGDLISQLEQLSHEIDLDATKDTCKNLIAQAQKESAVSVQRRDKEATYPLPKVQPVLDLFDERADLKGLPVRKGDECLTSGKPAEVMGQISRDLRRASAKRNRAGPEQSFSSFILADQALVSMLKTSKWDNEESIPALVQMLQAESAPVRQQLCEHQLSC
jgi:hypothetical protein